MTSSAPRCGHGDWDAVAADPYTFHRGKERIVNRIGKASTLAKWLVAGGATAALSIPFAVAHATTAPTATLFGIESTVPGMALQSAVDNKDGSATVTWAAPTGEHVTVTGRPGATVKVSGTAGEGPGELTIRVTPAPLDKSDSKAVAEAFNDFASGRRSVYRDALRVGMTEAEAATIAHGKPGSMHVATGGDIINSVCVDGSGDGGRAHIHFCDVQSVVQRNGSDWYVGDEMTGTAQDTLHNLFTTIGANIYGGGNTLVKWSPSGRINPSACASNTASVSWNGFSLSSTANACPDFIDPRVNPYGPGFGEYWHGFTHAAVGLNPVDVVHNPPSASPWASLHWYLHWE